jgi:hypothetical protein
MDRARVIVPPLVTACAIVADFHVALAGQRGAFGVPAGARRSCSSPPPG